MPESGIIPVLSYQDVPKAIEWLCNTFGFTERWRAGNHRAQLGFFNGAIALTDHNPAEYDSLKAARSHHSLMVRVPDIQRHYERTKESGALILQPPADFPYGERQYTVEDIGGHEWTFSETIADVAPEDWGGTTAPIG